MAVLTADDLERAGIAVEPEDVLRMLVEAVQRLPPAPRGHALERDLPPDERAALLRGGFSFDPLPPGVDPLAQTVAEYAALVATALPVAEAARLLGVDDSRIRQRLARRTLYGIKLADAWRLPAFQFAPASPGGLVPGLDRVLPRLDPALHPVGVYQWFTLPNPDLVLGDRPVSPLDWLRSGGDPAEAAALAADLQGPVPKLPEPPASDRLAALAPAVRVLPTGTELWRLYFRGGAHPAPWHAFRGYGPVRTARFDHHLPPPRPQERAIFYGALAGPTCVAEVFQHDRLIDRTTREPWLVGFATAAALRLLDLTGVWPTAAGASMALNSGPRPRAQRWSRAIYEAYRDIEGLVYPSSMHGNAPAVALYERAAHALPDAPFVHQPLAAPVLLLPLQRVAHQLGYRLT